MRTIHCSGRLGGRGVILPRGVLHVGVQCSGGCLSGGVCPGGVPPDPETETPGGQTDTCENTTFPQLLLRTVMTPYY